VAGRTKDPGNKSFYQGNREGDFGNGRLMLRETQRTPIMFLPVRMMMEGKCDAEKETDEERKDSKGMPVPFWVEE
jgi:hypothetical protein